MEENKKPDSLNQTASRIEQIVKKIGGAESEKKDEILGLLSKLKAEIDKLGKTHADHAESIVGFLGAATHEATRPNKSPALQKLSKKGLSSSVGNFEASHTRLVETVNELCSMLSSIGV